MHGICDEGAVSVGAEKQGEVEMGLKARSVQGEMRLEAMEQTASTVPWRSAEGWMTEEPAREL